MCCNCERPKTTAGAVLVVFSHSCGVGWPAVLLLCPYTDYCYPALHFWPIGNKCRVLSSFLFFSRLLHFCLASTLHRITLFFKCATDILQMQRHQKRRFYYFIINLILLFFSTQFKHWNLHFDTRLTQAASSSYVILNLPWRWLASRSVNSRGSMEKNTIFGWTEIN